MGIDLGGKTTAEIRKLSYDRTRRKKVGGVAKCPPDMPLVLHQQLDVLDAVVVGVVQPLGQVLLQVRPEVLLRLFALRGRREYQLQY